LRFVLLILLFCGQQTVVQYLITHSVYTQAQTPETIISAFTNMWSCDHAIDICDISNDDDV